MSFLFYNYMFLRVDFLTLLENLEGSWSGKIKALDTGCVCVAGSTADL